MARSLFRGMMCVWLAGQGLAAPAPAPVPKSPYIGVVYRYADTLIEKGRGSNHLFYGALDLETMRPLSTRPAAPLGLPEPFRLGDASQPLAGSNLQHEQNLMRLLYVLTETSTKQKYREAADAAVRAGLQAGMWPKGPENFFRPWVLGEAGFRVAPEASQKFALELIASTDSAKTLDARAAGFCLRIWAVAYTKTQDERFKQAIENCLETLEKRRDPGTGVIQNVGKGDATSAAAMISLAIDADGAAQHLPAPLAARLRKLAEQQDELFCSLPHQFSAEGDFVSIVKPGRPRDFSSRWVVSTNPVAAIGSSTAQIGMMCVSRYDNTGKLPYKKLLLAAADAYLKSSPAADADVWPRTFGQAISLQVAAWRHTARPVYFQRARELADLAIEKFFGTNALPRSSLRGNHYESATGGDTLALSLYELHLQVLHITAVRSPANTIDR